MDKVPQGAGMPGGAGIDGAFERFLTAAIATIITIMFSWRLLAEEEEAMGSGVTGSGVVGLGVRPPRPFSLPPTYRPLSTIPTTTKPNVLQQTTSQRSTGGICEIDISDDESSNYRESRSTDVDAIMGESVVYDEFIPSQRQPLQATSTSRIDDNDSINLSSQVNADDNLAVDTLTTWDEYKWEEETGEEEEFVIKTRRNVRSFARNPNALSLNNPNTSNASETSPDRTEASVSLPVPFSQRFADFVPDAGGDSGYIDLYPDVESDSDVTDSSDDERVYEIQVSDSDSDSEGDSRNSGFFGLTSLDTIIEEYESDASETGDVIEKRPCSNVDAKKSNIESPVAISETVKLLNSSVDKGDKSSHCDKDCDNDVNDDRCAAAYHGNNYRETDIDTGVSLLPNVKGTKTDVLSSTEVVLGQADDKATCQIETTIGQNDIPSSSRKASGVECNLPLDKTQPSQLNSSIPDALMGKKLHHDSSVNQDSQLYSPVTEVNIQPSFNQPIQEAYGQPENNISTDRINSNPIPTESHLSTSEANIIYSRPAKPEPINLKTDYYNFSEISDDSLPATPIHTCALDNLADEPFSDTESCSSGSVITVLSIQSTDSENRDKQSNFPVNKGENHSGKNKTPLLSVDQNNDSMGKYDNFSLVSGFLNDSLNSLLSANTGSEKDSSSDLESSGQEVTSQNEQLTPENQTPVQVNGKFTSDDSNVSSNESLPAVQEIVQNEQIQVNDNVNGHTTSSDSLNTDNTDAVNINSDVIPDYVDSDASSDSSDPPLREYDPRDDDLAAFQFNLDSDDDSFYLVIGGDSDEEDDGRLRNFETFTNLNSVGLAADYGDAVTSRTLSDDGKSFTFSQTEEVDTQFKKRGYFLEREVASSPNLGPLSPIISEDDEPKPKELSPTANDTETLVKEIALISSTYDDAECSMPSRGNDNLRDSAIDFNKYIIKSDLSPVTKNFPDFPAQNGNSSAMVERAKTNNDHSSIIDNEGDKMNNLGENVLNYSEALDRPAETLSGSNSNNAIENSHKFLSGHSDTSNYKPSSDLPNATSDSDTQNDSAQKSDLNSQRKLETNIDDIFETNVKSPEKISSPQKKDKVETLIDDIFDFRDESGNDNVNIDDIVIANTEKKTKFVQPKTIKRSHRRSSPLKATQSKHETNIDDIFASESTNQEVETNVDELFERELSHRTSAPVSDSKSRKETTIYLPDVVCDVNRNADVKNETCFDVTSDISGDTGYKHFVDILSSQTNDQPEVTSESAIFGASESLIPIKGVHVENDQIRARSVNNNELSADANNDFSLNHSSELNNHQNKTNNVTFDTDLAVDRTRDNLDSQTIEKQTTKPPCEQTIKVNYGQTYEQIEQACSSSSSESRHNEGKIIGEKAVNNYVETPPQIDTKYEQNNSDTLNKPLLQSNLDSTTLEQVDYNVKVSLPKAEILHSSIGSKRSGEIPEDSTTELDRNADKPTVQITSASDNVDLDLSAQEHLNTDFEHSYASESDERGVSFHDVEDSIISEDGVKADGEKDNKNNETELKIDEDSFVDAVEDGDDKQLDSISSCSQSVELSDDDSLSSFEESYHNIQATYNAIQARKLTYSSDGRVVRTPLQKPSELFGKAKDLKGVKRRVHRHQLKKYTSVLQQPITPEKTYLHVELPERPASVSRLKVEKSRERFLSEENLLSDSFEDKFIKHRTSLVASTPRKYLKRHERDLQSTESLPTDMSAWNTSYGSNLSIDHVHSVPVSMRIEELYNSRYSSHNSSFERCEYDKLHANCMFSHGKREQIEEIRHSTKSLENMFEQLLRYGSVSSDMETDIDAPDYQDPFISFQYPLERAASMSALIGSSETAPRPAKKTGKGRFANRKVPKSKSLQTLETNLDDVFADELGQSGELKKTPSVHELRVSKSLSKLNVPDWFRKSSFSRTGSTQSLFTYAGRTGSTSTLGSFGYPPSLTTSPTPSVVPGGNTVIIQKRVTPSPTTPNTSKVLRAPLLPTTPEKAPIHDIPSTTLPSDKYRKQECKSLKPIPILPFAKIREMFEKKAQETAADATTPTREKPSPTKDFPRGSPTKGSPNKDKSQRVHFEPSEIPTISEPKDNGHVESNRTSSPPPPLPERKPILTDTTKHSDSSNSQTRKQQVHFSDEKSEKKVSKPQEQKVDSKRQNGSTPSTSSSTVKKPSGLRAALPLPQFRFRRPGSYATKVATSNTQNSTTTQSKKGKNIDLYDDYDNCGEYQVNNGMSPTSPPPAWLHALELKARTDGETLFEFLQKRRYSSILENGFAEQMDELQDKDVIFNFPVMAVSNHSSNGDMQQNGSSDLRVVLTNAHNHAVQNGFLNNKLRSDAPNDDILDGLLLFDGYQTGRMRMNHNGLIVPKSPDSLVQSPDTPPGFAFLHPGIVENECLNSEENEEALFGPYDIQSEYILVKCENPTCIRETNLREAKKYFKSCHSCYTYYCSRKCRKIHWSPHKLVCVYSRINSACKHVIKFINKHSHLQYQCSRIARRGYLSQGRGCVVFAFPDIGSADDFLTSGMDSLWVPPVYVSLKELPNAVMLGSQLHILTETCKQYNPELKYVIHVTIVIPQQLPYRPVPRIMDAIIQRCAKLRLSAAHMHPKQEDSNVPSTLILTAVPGNQHADESDGRKTRELCFVNIQRKLRQRDVSLRHQFPEVYNRLIDFVSDAKHFSPMIIYPTDGRCRKRFMCVIMPEAEPEIEWIRDPDLFHELDVFEDEDTETSHPSYTIQHEVML